MDGFVHNSNMLLFYHKISGFLIFNSLHFFLDEVHLNANLMLLI